jgi:hypothetical protein
MHSMPVPNHAVISLPAPARRRPATRTHRQVDLVAHLRRLLTWRVRAPHHHEALAELRALQATDALAGFGRASQALR